MSIEVSIREPLGQRQALLPLVIGGPGSDLTVPGNDVSLRIEADGAQWLLRAIGQATVAVNGSVMRSPAPLVDFDVIRAGDAQLVVHPAAARIEVLHLAGNATVAPVQRHALPGEEVEAGVHEIIAAGGDAAARNATSPLPSRRGSLRRIAIAASLLLVVAAAGVLFALVPVAVQLTPAAASATVPGLFDWHAGDRVFLLPGQRTVTFSHPGYRSQRVTLEVTGELSGAAALPVTLELLPGLLTVNTQGEPAELLVDGVAVGRVPGEVEVAHGTREIIVRAPRRVDFVSRMEIEGGGRRQTLDVQLQPATGWLVLDTLPAAARVSVDGKELGNAPQKLELDSGLHKLAITAAGRRSWNSEIAIIAGQTLDLGRIDLALPAPAVMRAPELVADAGDAGGAAAAGSATPEPTPPTPPPPPPARLQSALLGTLILMPAGSYQQGSDRREQGRRANEVQRNVTLTRPFYLAETEVSNAQFRVFRPNHAAGIAMEKSLDLDKQAVSNVSWEDAIEFCNWLSLREGLSPAYERRDGRWQLVQKLTSGYRLPTEAEWEYAARYVNGQRWQRYAWGDTLPPPAGAANLAGQESLPTRPGPDVRLAAALPSHSDEHAVIAPVDSYGKSPAGFLNLGGNVSEWMHDVYATLPEAGPVTDPTGAQADGPHAIRGASWRTATIAELRLAWRERAAGPSQTIGFRVARYAEINP